MKVHGCDCSIAVKTSAYEIDIPYSEETIREAVSLLQEEPSIDGDGISRAMRKGNGVTGCVVTPLTIGTAPLLLSLAMGGSKMASLPFLSLGVLENSKTPTKAISTAAARGEPSPLRGSVDDTMVLVFGMW